MKSTGSDTVVLYTRIPRETKEHLNKLAKASGMSITATTSLLLLEATQGIKGVRIEFER